ncbi:MAG TPA: heparinase II/III family protein [Noviherbaspirillum sp.]
MQAGSFLLRPAFRTSAALVLAMALAPAHATGAKPVVTPQEAAAAYRRASSLPHPRFFKGDAMGKRLAARIAVERADGVRRMEQRLERHRGQTPAIAGMAQHQPGSRTDPRGAARTVSDMNRELAVLPEFALAWMLTHEPRWKDEFLRRLEASAQALDEVVRRKDYELVPLRSLVWAIALSLDIGAEAVPAPLASRALAGMSAAIGRARDGLLRSSADAMPNASRFHTLGRLCAAALLHAGQFDGDKAFIEQCLPTFLNRLDPYVYGGNDGGQFDGTSYTVWGTIELLLPWDIFKRVGGIDPYRIPWVRNVGDFFTYFVPPGAPAGAFGDGAEVRREEEWSRFTHQLASRVPSPLLRWAAAARVEADAGYLGMLLMPMPERPDGAPVPRGMPDAKAFHSVGWVAMHSSLTSKNRISLLFKASPFGSLGHAHADQNSLSMSVGDEQVLIDSGIYDWYGSPHSVRWYRQTLAHNAVTHDGGNGQLTGKATPEAGIRDFRDDGRVAAALGDAGNAYGDRVRQALRAVALVRPGTILVRDILRADQPRVWELNFHTRRAVEVLTPNRVRLPGREGRSDVCISILGGPDLEPAVTTGFPAPPERPPTRTDALDEHHIRFSATAAARSAEVVTAISVGCAEGDLRLKAGERAVRIGEHELMLVRDGRMVPAER